MITNLRLKNYKAFSDVNIPIRPLTFLVGANNTGKSSIINFLSMLRQTAEETGMFKSPLKNFGNFVNLGDIDNIWRMKNTDNPLVVEVSIKSDDILYNITQLYNNFIFLFHRFISRYEIYELNTSFRKFEDFEQDYSRFINHLKDNNNKLNLFKDYISIFTEVNLETEELLNDSSFLATSKFLHELKQLSDNSEFVFKYSFKYHKKNIETSHFGLFCNDVCIIETKINDDNSKITRSDIINEKDFFCDEKKISSYFNKKILYSIVIKCHILRKIVVY